LTPFLSSVEANVRLGAHADQCGNPRLKVANYGPWSPQPGRSSPPPVDRCRDRNLDRERIRTDPCGSRARL